MLSKRLLATLFALVAMPLCAADYRPPATGSDGWSTTDARAADWDISRFAALES